MQNEKRFLGLLQLYSTGNIGHNDRNELFKCIASGQYDTILADHIQSDLENNTSIGAVLPPQNAEYIIENILQTNKEASIVPVKSSAKLIWFNRLAAASVFLAITGFGAYLWKSSWAGKEGVERTSAKGKEDVELEIKKNLGRETMLIKLEDGSTVKLKPGASLQYPKHFAPEARMVKIDGEAFFDVQKNPIQPFYVYYNHLATRVLGTSFTVKTDKATKSVEVSVRTGRVEVYEDGALPQKKGVDKIHNPHNGVILTPNQKVIYHEDARMFEPMLVEEPVPMIENKRDSIENFAFEDASLRLVFNSLEKTYGIELQVEDDRIYSCLFTGDLNKVNLFTKLDVVCQSVGASYEVKGTKILIKGKGCR